MKIISASSLLRLDFFIFMSYLFKRFWFTGKILELLADWFGSRI